VVALEVVGLCAFDVKPPGPDQVYEVAAGVVRAMFCPTQYGPALLADVVGVRTFTLTVPVLVHPSEVTVTVYTPMFAVDELATVGFCKPEVNPPGPLHAYPVPPLAVRFRGLLTQTGLLLPTIGFGVGLTVTLVVMLPVHPFASVTVNVYKPLLLIDADDTEGFCRLDENAGPAHV
jgi:hypothetical protein